MRQQQLELKQKLQAQRSQQQAASNPPGMLCVCVCCVRARFVTMGMYMRMCAYRDLTFCDAMSSLQGRSVGIAQPLHRTHPKTPPQSRRLGAPSALQTRRPQ